jgi:hypothetical protein
VRALTDAEARVIGTLLASIPDPERDRLRQIGVPRSTYHAARRRAYLEGWVRDRYVPDPALFGYPLVTFLLARPFAERAGELLRLWEGSHQNVVTWGSPRVALGVFFHERPQEAQLLLHQITEPRSTSTFLLSAESDHASIPVYFDYEGLWANLTAADWQHSYPQGLGGAPDPAGREPKQLADERKSWAARELVHRPFVAEAAGKAGHLVGPLGVPWGQQRLLRSVAIRHRVFLDPGRVPSHHDRSADQVTLLTGRLRAGSRADSLFALLTGECRVFPFLYVAEGDQLLMGALGASSPSSGRPGLTTARRPVMPTLQEHLSEIDLIQEPAAQIRATVDHRYDRLFPSDR